MVRLSGPAQWCEQCQTWWPGRWLVGFPDDDQPGGIRPPTAAEIDEYAYWCPECGGRLEPRMRPWTRGEGQP
jgi:hypothetical protein